MERIVRVAVKSLEKYRETRFTNKNLEQN